MESWLGMLFHFENIRLRVCLYMRRFTSTLQAWHKIVLFSAHVQINFEKNPIEITCLLFFSYILAL